MHALGSNPAAGRPEPRWLKAALGGALVIATATSATPASAKWLTAPTGPPAEPTLRNPFIQIAEAAMASAIASETFKHADSHQAGSGLRLRETALASEPMRDTLPSPSPSSAMDRRAPLIMAQFQLPESKPGAQAPPAPLPGRLTYQYVYGSETTLIYRKDRDLDRRVRDNSNILAPNINGIVIYRPFNWLETTLELIFEREIAAKEEDVVLLPDGSRQVAQRRRNSLLVDQAHFTIRDIIAPFEFTVGRKNYEDDRRWLYDTSMDVVSTGFRWGRWRAEALVGREIYRSLELAPRRRETPDYLNTQVYHAEYRGFEDLRLSTYAIARHDQRKLEGRPWHLGVRALGTPNNMFSYWVELGLTRGRDEQRREYSGRGYDIGGTYRFIGLPYFPSFTLGYAFGSGGGNDPSARRNYDFRQTGLHSNEWKFAGIPQFKVYGEGLDPDLTNLQIFTAGVGFYPAPRVSVDLVYHRYRTDKIVDEVRNGQITAQMAQVDTHLSKDVGQGVDVIIGVRNLFGIRRLGLDLRMGWFYPGKAYLRNEGTEDRPDIRRANKAVGVTAKLWW